MPRSIENLAAGTGNSYGIPQAIKSWADEASEYQTVQVVHVPHSSYLRTFKKATTTPIIHSFLILLKWCGKARRSSVVLSRNVVGFSRLRSE